MATKKKKIATEATEAPKETAMDLGVKIMELARESGTTEAEYQEPVVPEVEKAPLSALHGRDRELEIEARNKERLVSEYISRNYPGLENTQNIPRFLMAILRELVERRF